MRKKTEKKIRRLTKNQAVALETFITLPSAASGATGMMGPSLGGTVSSLERSGIIQPIGREGRQFNWEIVDPDISHDAEKNRKEVLELIKRISGDSK